MKIINLYDSSTVGGSRISLISSDLWIHESLLIHESLEFNEPWEMHGSFRNSRFESLIAEESNDWSSTKDSWISTLDGTHQNVLFFPIGKRHPMLCNLIYFQIYVSSTIKTTKVWQRSAQTKPRFKFCFAIAAQFRPYHFHKYAVLFTNSTSRENRQGTNRTEKPKK